MSRPWGFQIAGLAVHITGEGPRFHPAGFAPTAPPVLTLIAAPHTTGAPLRPAGEPAAEQDSWAAFYQAPTDEDDSHVTFLSKSGYASPPETIRIDFGEHATTGSLRFRADGNPALVTFPLDQLLLIHLLSQRQGMVVHGAAISDGQRGVLLVGPSGAGKTTTARAAADAGLAVLSDERTVIRLIDGVFHMAGTPWYGDGAFYDPRVLPVAAICALTQSDRDALEPISPARMLAELYRCHFPPMWSDAATAETLATAEAFISSVPRHRLHNTRGGKAVDLVRTILSA